MMPSALSAPTTATKPVRAGVIGAGVRGACYFTAIPSDVQVSLAAIADPSPHNRTAFAERFGTGQRPTEYADGLELLATEQLDALVVASPNNQHVTYAVDAMKRSLPLLLEKPVATTVDDLATLWSAYNENDPGHGHTVVGFVLRYTPFYSKIREVVQSGRLGDILSIEASEHLDTGLTMIQYRGWRQDTTKSGGWMVEKCCHDMDILGHILDSRPRRVFSMASAMHLRPRDPSEQLARFQPDAGTAQIDFGDADTNAALADTVQHSPYAPSGLPDRQVATIEFDNGTMATFNAVMAQPKNDRRIRIYGTHGELEGSISTGAIRISDTDPAGTGNPSIEDITVSWGNSGHHGGDEVLGDTFWHLAAGGDRVSRAGLADGIDAVLTAIALQQSAETGTPVELDDLRRRVFGPMP